MSAGRLNDHLAHLLAQANRHFSRRLSASGVPFDQWRVLAALGAAGGSTMGELADSLAIHHPTATKMVDRMVDEALMYRVPDPADRRKVRMFLSDKGKLLLDQHDARVRDYEAQVEATYGDADSRRLKGLLETLIGQLS